MLEYEEEIEKWRELYEQQSLKKQELSKAVETKNQVYPCNLKDTIITRYFQSYMKWLAAL